MRITKMQMRIGFSLLIVLTILWAIFIGSVLMCYGSEKVKNNSSTKELQIRKQKFQQCLLSGTPRSKCIYLYY